MMCAVLTPSPALVELREKGAGPEVSGIVLEHWFSKCDPGTPGGSPKFFQRIYEVKTVLLTI